MWDAEQYHCHRRERSQPFHDLLSRVPDLGLHRIVDLGCGSGDLTRLLAERWPDASVLGIDSSAEMLAAAAQHAEPGRLEFQEADLAKWSTPELVGLIVANAALHWVERHEELLPRLVKQLEPGGILAIQMPYNFGAPSHVRFQEVCSTPRWSPRIGHLVRQHPVQEPSWYVRLLSALGLDVQAWETTYLQILQGEAAVLEWMKGTTLRPVLSALDEAGQIEFLGEYNEELDRAYPHEEFGTLFPFRRIFFVAQRRPT